MGHEIRLRIEINNRNPVELGDFTRSLSCMADEYRRFLTARETKIDADNIKLYVEAIHTGSIITDLVALSPFSLDLIENTKTVIEFAKYLKTSYDTLLGKS